jgi:hypothetical protein
MTRPDWLTELEALAARFVGPVGPDLAGLALADLWGVYRFLKGLAERGG